MGDSNQVVRTSTSKILLMYARQHDDYETVLKMLVIDGIDSKEWRLRLYILEFIPAFIRNKPQLVTEECKEFIYLLESLVL